MRLKAIFYLLIHCLFSPVYSQELHTLWFHSLSERQELSQSYNWYIYHDSEGFVWISSLSGLNRFDGYQVKQYHAIQGDTTALSGEIIHSEFFEDQAQNLWFCTLGAIHSYQRKHDNFQHYQLKDENNQVIAGQYLVYFLEKDTFLWVRAGKGIYRMDIHHPDKPVKKIIETNQFRCRLGLSPDKAVNRLYLFGAKNGIELYHVNHGKVVSAEEHFAAALVRELLPKSDTLVWITTNEHGLIRWNPLATTPSRLRAIGIFAAFPSTMVAWGDDRLLILAKGRGIFLLDESDASLTELTCKFIGEDESPIQSFKGAFIDKDENLWISDETNGLHYANLRKVKLKSLPKLKPPGQIKNYSYWALVEDQNGNIWQGTSPAGVFLSNSSGKLIRHFLHQPKNRNSLPSNQVTDIIYDKIKNRIWIVSSHGLVWCKPEYPGFFHPVPNNLKAKKIRYLHLHQTQSGKILVTSEGYGIFEIKETRHEIMLTEIKTTANNSYQTIFEDKEGRLFTVKNDAYTCVFQYQNDVLTLVDSLPFGGLINGFYEDELNNDHWFASSEGLVKLNKSIPDARPEIYTVKDGLPGNFIGEIAADDYGNLWLGTNKGLSYFNKNRLESLRTFTLADGALSPEFHITAVLKRRNGDIMFAGSNGITIVPAGNTFHYLKTPPKIKITAIKIHDEEPKIPLRCAKTQATNVSQIKHLSLPYEDHTISFEFVALEFSDPPNNQLKYQLLGVDEHWVSSKKGEPGFARYSGLDAKTYTLLVKAANSDGFWTDPVKLLTFTIRPPWYATWWARMLQAATILALLYGFYRFRVNQIRKREEMRRMEAEYKQKEAEIKQQMSETETAILRLQMNPHFIFNSMNSISSYILKKDITTANNYLGRFAKLMRMILDLAAKPRIAVADEIELLELYMNTEAMRFEQQFTYEVSVDDALDPEEILLPTMILQPFVENAIWHGLSGKKEPGHIRIRFQKEGDLLLCSVEDNGLGRPSTGSYKPPGHESKALGITARRLKLLEEETGVKSSYEIIDLKDTLGNPAGTSVKIHIPLMEE